MPPKRQLQTKPEMSRKKDQSDTSETPSSSRKSTRVRRLTQKAAQSSAKQPLQTSTDLAPSIQKASENQALEKGNIERAKLTTTVLQAATLEGENLIAVAERLTLGIQPLLDIFGPLVETLQAPLVAQKPRRKRRKQTNSSSPFFAPAQGTVAAPLKRLTRGPRVSPPFSLDPFSQEATPSGLSFKLRPSYYGLIQERIRNDLFALVVQAILWNQTTGKTARPVLFRLLGVFPTPHELANASYDAVNNIIKVLGLGEVRTTRLLQLAAVWVAAPPSPTRRYGRRNYPHLKPNKSVKDKELLEPDDQREGFEIAHLPGVGPYALDSYRIFYRDTLRGIDENQPEVEPEWKRVVPLDKDLRPYLQWKWRQAGWDWDPLTGRRTEVASGVSP
ncbi:DNA glycosylase [Lophiotrema nucula]|uniref:DNA glycosylase n=1 Tax=Lophiotrema nucula TaxID=690887 RepID=A0A6A5ZJH0_9PLEO|nr:DNA glycosylase [Lophiotrema nucula]